LRDYCLLEHRYKPVQSCVSVELPLVDHLKVLSDENKGGSKLVSIDSFFFTV
jgi:hypothetical protein